MGRNAKLVLPTAPLPDPANYNANIFKYLMFVTLLFQSS